ncbi:DUF1440 domain-containing protein [Novosphingobium sp. 9]|uniref:DUF1440 domain-containing protein n=1 Tax=Novosphingobium sp. 9 TaxID=2025349 RepID=UPI0021B54566|nr:DUF1440 domain-containing protein [Novosphingobium sp. 9]
MLQIPSNDAQTPRRPTTLGVDTLIDIGAGAAAGGVAGIAASAIMNGFQRLVSPIFEPTSAGLAPATERAANRVAIVLTGSGISKEDRTASGTAVHYIVGTATGALYGAMAETQPKLTRWHGLAFGLVAATLVDQLAVPLLGLARPPWRYTLRTHLYGYASHLVFGLATEATRRFLRERLNRTSATTYSTVTVEDIAMPLMLGFINGQRTFTPPATVTLAAAGSGLGLGGTPLAILNSKWTGTVLGAAALAEFFADKQPGIAARTTPAALAGRAFGGAVSGAAAARPGKAWLSAGIGAAAAIAGGYLSYRARLALARAIGRDRPVAIAEDIFALLGSAAIASYAAMRQKQREALPPLLPAPQRPSAA